jgi:hypothetical protein
VKRGDLLPHGVVGARSRRYEILLFHTRTLSLIVEGYIPLSDS